MAASGAFSLIEEFYFFAAIAATSLIEHLFRCSPTSSLASRNEKLGHIFEAKIPSAVFSSEVRCCLGHNIYAV